jgi:hypothetical protein
MGKESGLLVQGDLYIPAFSAGWTIYFQSAERGTCPVY